MTKFLAFICLLVHASTAAAPRQQTMRVDYYHTGNAKEERFSLDRVVLEPLPWPGQSGAADRRHQPRQVPVRGRRRRQRTRALLARVQLDLRRVGDDGRSQDDRTARFPNRCDSRCPTRRSASSSRSAMRATCSATSGRCRVDPADKFVDARCGGPDAGRADQAARERRSGDEAGPADPRRRLHRARARQVRARRAPAGRRRCSRRRRSRSGSATSTSGASVRRPRESGDLAAVAAHLPPVAARRHLRRVRFRALRADLREQGASATSPRTRRTTSSRFWRTARPTAAAASSVCTARWRPTAPGRRTSSCTSSAITSPASPTSTTPRTSPICPRPIASSRGSRTRRRCSIPATLKWKDLVDAGHAAADAVAERGVRDATRRRSSSGAARFAPRTGRSRRWTRCSARRRSTTRRCSNEGPHAGKVGAFEGANYEARGYYRPQADCIMFTRDNVPFCAVCRRAIEAILDLYAR